MYDGIQYIPIAEDENEEAIEVPCEPDGTLLLSTVDGQLPGACGLKYRNPETNTMRGIRLADGRIYPPDNIWGSHTYYAVFPKENKRKGDDGLENPTAKTKRLDTSRCSDLIVLGLPFKCSEDDLKTYFTQFGEVVMAQVKRDKKTGSSRGYGFIRFSDHVAQTKCMSKRHMIDDRWCDVRIPNSKEGSQQTLSRKVFVGRCTEEMTSSVLREYFSKYGEVLDVFIPNPFRAFAFVTFADAGDAQALFNEDHIIKGISVHLGSAAPVVDRRGEGQSSQGGFGMGGSGRGGYDQVGEGWGGGYNQGYGNNMGNVQMTPQLMAAAQAVLSCQQQSGWGQHGDGSSGPQGYGSNSYMGWDGGAQGGNDMGYRRNQNWRHKSGGGGSGW